MLATRVPAAPGDGTPSFVLDGAIALSDRFDVVIIAPRMRGTLRVERHGNVSVVRFPYFPRRWERLADDAIMPQLQLDRRLWMQAVTLTICMLGTAWTARRRFRPIVIHAHWIVPSGLIARILRFTDGTPYILTSHGADAFAVSEGFFRRLKALAVKGASQFVSVSEEISQRYADVTERRAVQPAGVDFDAWNHVRQSRAPEPRRALFIGRLTEKKGVDILLRSTALVPELSVRIAGDGPDLPALLLMRERLDLVDRVHFLGRLSRKALEHELRTAAMVVIPSVVARNGDRDGTPTVLAEAIAAGVPVICSRIAGLADYVENDVSGLSVTPGDVGELADALRWLVTDPASGDRLAAEALARLRVSLDSAVAADRYAAWYLRHSPTN